MLAEPVDAGTRPRAGPGELGRPRRGAARGRGGLWRPGWPPGPPCAYAAIKEALLFGAEHGLHESLAKEADLQQLLGQTRDHQEATRAFLRKEQPVFEGR